MKTTDLFGGNRSAKRINESMEKLFGTKLDLASFDLPKLEDARNKIRTQLSQVRTNSGFNETIENEAVTQAQWMLDAINAEIIEREEFIADPHVAEVSEESDGSESEVMRRIVSGELDAYDVLNTPNGEMEQAASEVLQQMYDDISIDHGLHPDDDFEEILNLVVDRLDDEYGSADEGGETDDAYALASAGFGNDEDYGYHGEGFDDNAKPGDTFKTRTGTATKTDKGMVHRKDFTAKGKKDRNERDDDSSSYDNRLGAMARFHEPRRSTRLSDEPRESAPPGAKAERTVKHIKAGYAKDGKLTDKEKSIAYATAWKQHNKQNESVNQGDNMTRKLTEGEIQQAQSIVTAKTMVDRVGRWIEELSGMENDTLLQLGDQIRDEMSAEQAKTFISSCAPAIQAALQNLKDTRETLATGVRMLTGEEQGAEMLGGEPGPDLGSDMGGEAGPDMMNAGDELDALGGAEDEFGAADAAVGGMETAGREQRESIDRSNSLLRVLAG